MRSKLSLLIASGVVAFLIPAEAMAQVAGNPVVTIVRKTLNPPGPAVGTNYQVFMEVHTREAGVVRGSITVPPRDTVISQNPLEQYIGAGQTAVYTFTVRCGESGGLVQFFANRKEPSPAPAPAAVGLEPTRDGRTVNSSLADTDSKDSARTASYAKIFQVRMHQGRTYVIDMVSTQIDPYLRLENAAGKQLAQDDDSGGFPNARIIFQAPEDGTYRIICTSYVSATGGFTLLIREQ